MADEPFAGEARSSEGGQGRVGGGLAGRRGGLRRLLLQHRPDPRRAARTRPACARRCSRACGRYARADRPRRRPLTADDIQGGAASCSRSSSAIRNSRARPRSGWSRPRPRAWSRGALRDPFDHWLTGNPTAATALLDHRHRAAPRSGSRRKKAKEEVARKPGDPQAAPARQARRLRPRRARRHRDLPRRGRLAPAARPSRRATARPRRSCPCAARSSTSPRPPPTSSAANKELQRPRCMALGCGAGKHSGTRTCATTGSSS